MTTPPLAPVVYGPAGARVTITTTQRPVAAALRRMFHMWWNPLDPEERTAPAAHLTVVVDRTQAAHLARAVTADPAAREHSDGRRILRHTTTADGVIAVESGSGTVYEVRGTDVTVTARTATAAATAAVRMTGDLVRARMEAAGFRLLRASSVTWGDAAAVIVGPRRRGTTTATLYLGAYSVALGVQSPELVLARPEPDGTVTTRPWPTPVTVSLGLLTITGWHELVRHHLAEGQDLHPASDPRAAGILRGTGPAPQPGTRDADLTVSLWPDVLRYWLSIQHTHHGTAAALIFPGHSPGGLPAMAGTRRTVNVTDLLPPGPPPGDPLGVTGPHAADQEDTGRLLAALNRLTRQSLTLTRHPQTDADLLAGYVQRLPQPSRPAAPVPAGRAGEPLLSKGHVQ
ncbi:hypothetical protein SAMN05216251_12753 [Actinacidiphila alni]|uniref:Uncharacterized protein n=1 Tax=Actinacidiphila alni TaxID=380248 RepID=A0A1I2LCH7_9ACTN|nr:hypothetical protein [Actinacidiphila alni]SFF75187.1 hypothetical protein SAMN05216251_12753 [Actinacidiphila alni]